mmetsp:Transcript_101971/g.161163  ORF Transcript_101971/g.161163 Transcript_101971/m.161163 type:complete len:254 (+) Transcript_101971:46-807(+)
MEGIAVQPEPNDDRAIMLATYAANNDLRGARRVIARDPGAVNEPGIDGTIPLCAAALWGHADMLRLLLESMASPGAKNENGPQWTALHAAALQEEGKACMSLLDFKANPLEGDVDGATPCDYASCSEAIWPLFAARGCERTPKDKLLRLGVIRKASSTLEAQLQAEAEAEASVGQEASRRGILNEYSRPGSSYVVTKEFPPRPGSSIGGYPSCSAGTSSRGLRSGRSNSRPIDILEEEDGAANASKGLRSLQI